MGLKQVPHDGSPLKIDLFGDSQRMDSAICTYIYVQIAEIYVQIAEIYVLVSENRPLRIAELPIQRMKYSTKVCT